MFLKSYEWRRFQESVGNKIFVLDDENYLIKLGLHLAGKSFLYSPSENSFKFLDKIKEIGEKENAIFFKYEPMMEIPNPKLQTPNNFQIPNSFKFSRKPIQPQKTLVVDLMKSEGELLSEMHQKTRYNIKVAQRSGVDVKLSDDIENFLELLQKTAKRDKFHTYQKEYYEKLLQLDNVKLFSARFKEKQIAFAMVIFSKETATYLHGASDDMYKKYMAPHLLHWEIIKYAKVKGCSNYDFWGIDKKKWPGVTRFKTSFGGNDVGYIGSYDYPLQKFWYMLYKLLVKV